MIDYIELFKKRLLLKKICNIQWNLQTIPNCISIEPLKRIKVNVLVIELTNGKTSKINVIEHGYTTTN